MRALVILGALLPFLSMQAFIVESRPLPEAIGVDELRSYLTTFGYLTNDSEDLESGVLD